MNRFLTMKRLSLMFVVLFGLSSAAGETPAAVPLPPYAGAYQPQTVDERGAWMMADEAERSLRDSPALIGDPALNAYLQRVLCRTVGQDRCRGIRIYILRVADVNASMMANGAIANSISTANRATVMRAAFYMLRCSSRQGSRSAPAAPIFARASISTG